MNSYKIITSNIPQEFGLYTNENKKFYCLVSVQNIRKKIFKDPF